jgi:hypothetical protein
MKCRFLLLADEATPTPEGKLNVSGEFNLIRSPSVPFAHPKMSVVAKFEAHQTEGLEHAAQVKIAGPDGADIFQTPIFPLKFWTFEAGVPIIAGMITNVAGVVFPEFGDYSVHLFVDGVAWDETAIYVRPL